MQNTMTPVRPVKPVAAYIGGKSKLAPEIVRLINQVPHQIYVECFMGMGGVFLRREFQPKSEVINDYSGDVANLFRILQYHYQQFMDELKWKLTSRHEFERLMKEDPSTLTDLRRAARFLYLQRTAFGGKVAGRNFGISPASPARFDITKLGIMLQDVHERLSGVVIENLDYKELIKRYDRDEALFYLDPPYYECEGDYGPDLFSRDEFKPLAALLAEIKGKFILSINDTPEVREIFSAFHQSKVGVKYTVGGGDKQASFGELIIMNYEPSALLL